MTRAAGTLAAAAQLAAGELVAAALPGARGPIAGVGQRIIHMTPGPAADFVVATAQTADKALLRAGVIAGTVAAGALAGERALPVLACAGAASGLAGVSCEDARTAPTLLAAAAGAGAGAGALRLLGPAPGRGRMAGAGALVGIAAAAAAAVDRAGLRRLGARRRATAGPGFAPPSPEAGLAVEGISPLYTPVEDFYVTDVAARAPRVDPERWRLRVHGMVESDFDLALGELHSMGGVELDATLVCVHNPVGGDRIGTARWYGVPLADLLGRAGVEPGAEQLLSRSVDGFTAGVPLDWISSGAPALLALGMNGEPLPVEHGFPARLIVPGLWGADASTKWVTELEVTTWDAARDYWDRRGWPRQPSRVQPAARIDIPVNRARPAAGVVAVAGVAWGPPEGVEGVEVQVDDGEWRAAELGVEVGPAMWRQWRWMWAAAPGEHVVRARALGRRRRQPGGAEPPYPVGVRGYHERRVSVSAHARGRRPLQALADDARGRVLLAARGVVAWRDRGFPPAPRFPAPRTSASGK